MTAQRGLKTIAICLALTMPVLTSCGTATDSSQPASSFDDEAAANNPTPQPSSSVGAPTTSLLEGQPGTPGSGSELAEYFEQDSASVLRVYADQTSRSLVTQATARLIQACMARAGFDYPIELPRQSPPNAASMAIDQAVGVVSVSEARSIGYVPALTAAANAAGGDVDAAPERTDKPYLDVLFGQDRDVPVKRDVVDPASGQVMGQMEERGGCAGEADRSLFGSAEERAHYYSLDLSLQNAGRVAVQTAQTSQAMLAVAAEWSACMSSSGYSFSLPSDPLDRSWPEPRPSEEEIRVAVADADCKEQVGLMDTFRTEVRNAAARSEATLAQTLAEWKVATGTLNERAADALAGG